MAHSPRPLALVTGQAMPQTERGLSVAYGPPPWHMAGRALAFWFRLQNPDEARRHVPTHFAMADDPLVRARFWDLTHDAGLGDDTTVANPAMTTFREATVAFPVSFDDHSGDNTVHMYADDPVYTAFARETMGWPVRVGTIHLTRPWSATLAPGVRLTGVLERHGHRLMQGSLRLSGPVPAGEAPTDPPRWLTDKVIPGVAGPEPQLHQVVRTGAEWVRWGQVWEAEGELAFSEGPNDELHFLTPREVVKAQYWSDLELRIGYGAVLADRMAAAQPLGRGST